MMQPMETERRGHHRSRHPGQGRRRMLSHRDQGANTRRPFGILRTSATLASTLRFPLLSLFPWRRSPLIAIGSLDALPSELRPCLTRRCRSAPADQSRHCSLCAGLTAAGKRHCISALAVHPSSARLSTPGHRS